MSSDRPYEYIDLDMIRDMTDGDNDFLLQMLDIYLSTIPKDIASLQKAGDTGTANEVIFCAHKLKGTFNYLGNKEVVALLVEIEHTAKDDTTKPQVSAFVAQVVRLTQLAIADLEQLKKDVQ